MKSTPARRRRPRHLIAAPRGTPRADALAVVRPRAPRPRLRFLLGRRGGRNLWSCQQGRGLGGRRRAGRIIRCPSFVRRRSRGSRRRGVPSPSFVGRVWRQRWPRRARVPVSTLIGEAFHAGPVARCRTSQGRGGLLGPHRAVYASSLDQSEAPDKRQPQCVSSILSLTSLTR